MSDIKVSTFLVKSRVRNKTDVGGGYLGNPIYLEMTPSSPIVKMGRPTNTSYSYLMDIQVLSGV